MSEPTHGVQHVIAVKNASTVAVTDAFPAQSFEVNANREQQESYQLGSPDVQKIHSGKKSNSGSFEREWISTDPGALAARFEEALDAGTEIWIAQYPEGDAAPEVKNNEAKIETWNLSGNLDGTVKERVGYKFKSLAITP